MFLSEFLMLVFAVSIVVSLTVEALKKMLGENRKLPTNILTGITSIVTSTVMGICYFILIKIPFTADVIIYLVAIIFISWLCAMLGYDKVIQSIKQIKK